VTRANFEEAVVAARGWATDGVSSARVFRPQVASETARKGIYFALDLYGELDYIGSASRARDGGLANRVLRHTSPRRSRWRSFYLLPLRDETPTRVVREIEGDCIRRFGPPGNINVPGIAWVPRYPVAMPT
jgi:hypothetical protein